MNGNIGAVTPSIAKSMNSFSVSVPTRHFSSMQVPKATQLYSTPKLSLATEIATKPSPVHFQFLHI